MIKNIFRKNINKVLGKTPPFNFFFLIFQYFKVFVLKMLFISKIKFKLSNKFWNVHKNKNELPNFKILKF